MVATLEDILQGKGETLRDYIKRFNKEVVQFLGADVQETIYVGKRSKKVKFLQGNRCNASHVPRRVSQPHKNLH